MGFERLSAEKTWFQIIEAQIVNYYLELIFKITRLLVSGRSPECFDCLLRFYGAV